MPERIEISVIPNDSRHEDTIIQITDCLDNLRLAASHIFQSIDDRVAAYSKRLLNIKSKTNKIESQLSCLQNTMSMKAVKMYSDAKYPANNIYQEYQTIIETETSEKRPDNQDQWSNSDRKRAKPVDAVKSQINVNHYAPELNLKEKLQFYYVMGKALQRRPGESSSKLNIDKVSSVSALLMNEPSLESLDDQALSRGRGEQMQDAPDSIGQPWRASDIESPSYLYAPMLGEVPQINVPAILPDLPGIVDDEKFVLDLTSQSPIAPSSAVTSPTLRIDLPDTIETTDVQFNQNELQVHPPNLPNIGDSEPQEGPVLPPPPPPPPAPLPEVPVATQPIPIHSAPLPPPPPPPPAPETPADPEPKIVIKSPPPPPPGDDRGSLMAAIRAAGGVGKAKLRQTTSIVEKPEDRFSSASVGGDLMADLHAKLAMRRKAMTGGTVGALERISRLIPPPPKPNETSDRNSATSEYDSQNDNDDWEE